MKIIFRVIGVFLIICGLFFFLFNITFITRSHTEIATITGILERRSGTNYNLKESGSQYHCKLKLLIKSIDKELVTTEEHHPCSPLFNSYYQSGQEIAVRTDGIQVQIQNFVWELIMPILLIIFGIGALLIKIPIQHKRK